MQPIRLVVSEQFYSLQGEGPSVGRPAIFLRLAGCNLNCNGFSYQDPTDGSHLGCDSKLVWKQGTPYAVEALLQIWQNNTFCQHLAAGAHLVITGGEPLLQQIKITEFLKQLDIICRDVYVEMETNGTVLPNEYLSQRINQFNVSPKLTSSLEPKKKAYRSSILRHFVTLPQAIFKFVIQTEIDIQEVISAYQITFHIPCTRIWLMPEGGTRQAIEPKMAWLGESCKQYGFNLSLRLHILLWDEATGV